MCVIVHVGPCCENSEWVAGENGRVLYTYELHLVPLIDRYIYADI